MPRLAGPGAAALVLAAQIAAAGGGALASLLFSRLMGPAAFGAAMLMISAAMLGSVLASLNVEAGAMRWLTRGSRPARAGFLRAAWTVTAAMSGAIGALLLALWFFASPATGPALPILALLVPALAALRVTARAGAALGAPMAAALPRILARPLVFLLAALTLTGIGHAPPPLALPALLLAASLAAIGVQHALLARRFRALGPAACGALAAPVATGLRLGPSLLLLEYYRDLALIAAGLALPVAGLGTLALAFTLAALPGLAVTAAEIAYGPRIAAAQGRGDRAETTALLRAAAASRAAGFALCAAGLWAVSGPLSAVLPAAFEGLSPVLWTLAAIPATRAVFGNPVLLLTLARRERAVFGVCATGLPLAAISVALAGLAGGALGAAAAASIAYAAITVTLWLAARRATGHDPSLGALLAPGPPLRQTAPAPGHRSAGRAR